MTITRKYTFRALYFNEKGVGVYHDYIIINLAPSGDPEADELAAEKLAESQVDFSYHEYHIGLMSVEEDYIYVSERATNQVCGTEEHVCQQGC